MGVDPAVLTLRCPVCGEELWTRRRGQWVLRNAILKLESLVEPRLVAKCPRSGCDAQIPVPFLELVEPPARRLPRRRLVIRRGGLVDDAGNP